MKYPAVSHVARRHRLAAAARLETSPGVCAKRAPITGLMKHDRGRIGESGQRAGNVVIGRDERVPGGDAGAGVAKEFGHGRIGCGNAGAGKEVGVILRASRPDGRNSARGEGKAQTGRQRHAATPRTNVCVTCVRFFRPT